MAAAAVAGSYFLAVLLLLYMLFRSLFLFW